MAKYDVRFTIPPRDLGNEKAVFKVRRDGKVQGTLKIAKANITWAPTGKVSKVHHMTWGEFDELVSKHVKHG